MKIIVNDTNIFIDMHSIGLLKPMCELPYEIHTVDFVIAELIDPVQSRDVNELVETGKIIVNQFSAEELMEIVAEFHSVSGNLSLPDCSVCYYAKRHRVPMITGDRRLRKHAELQSIEVHGILFLFDELVANSIISPIIAADKLEYLITINARLPRAAIRERIENWRLGHVEN